MKKMIAQSAIISPAQSIAIGFIFIFICVNPVHLWLAFSISVGTLFVSRSLRAGTNFRVV